MILEHGLKGKDIRHQTVRILREYCPRREELHPHHAQKLPTNQYC
jgi:hypothetical protein